MREIKFRAWYPYGDEGEMVNNIWIDLERGSVLSDNDDLCEREGHSGAILMQFTGLLDKNGLQEVYENDIIDSEGIIIGNKYEDKNLLEDKTNMLIQGFGGEAWCSTYKEAMERGLKNS